MPYSTLIAHYIKDALRCEPSGGPMTERVRARVNIEEGFYSKILSRRGDYIPTEMEEELTLVIIGTTLEGEYEYEGEILSGALRSYLEEALIPTYRELVKGKKGNIILKRLGFRLIKARLKGKKAIRNIVAS